jgi:hypothetical protein
VAKSLFQFTVRPSEPGEVIMEKTVAAALRQVFIMKDGDMVQSEEPFDPMAPINPVGEGSEDIIGVESTGGEEGWEA